MIKNIQDAYPFVETERIHVVKNGIDPDEFCESSPSRRTVQIHRATQPAVIR